METQDVKAEKAKAHAEKPSIYLTFDDGPFPATAIVLDVLAEQQVKATFFLCAKNLAKDGDRQYRLIRRMLDEGHTLGNHGYDHDPMNKTGYLKAGTDSVKKDFTDNLEKLQQLFKKRGDTFPSFTVARLPGAGSTLRDFTTMVTNQLKLPHAHWTLEFAPNGLLGHLREKDWRGIKGVAAEFARLPVQGDIVLMHDHHWNSKRNELTALIAELKVHARIVSFLPLPKGHKEIKVP